MIKQITLLIFLFIATLSNCFAQKVQNRNLLSVSAGPSFPLGDFASTNIQNKQSGFALTGEEVDISYVYKFSQKFGLTATLFGQRNTLNIKSMKQQWSEMKFAGPGGAVSYSNWHFEKHDWLAASLLLGGAGTFPIGNGSKLAIVIKGMAGLIYVASPEIKAESTTDTTITSTSQTSESAWGFSYRAYGGLQYKVSPKMRLLFGINYLGTARITFSEITAGVKQAYQPKWDPENPGSSVVSVSTVTGSQKQVIQTLGLHVGVAWEL